ncbi:hypothetical protein PAN31117_01674 [Pandoraea anapnoica]|uniref:Uncharacterized protein n=1 Tax=Pandoraea anapnoica TaxID=2508301 RepID=A0A5E4ZTZ5_9BURK|nr:hypothetical protein [Pandoraea anapnoica]VVE64851.1 hypothetical protein PAN31117_01674 [Pandoraea anapnoica]
MNPSTVSSMGVQPPALTLSDTQPQAPTKEDVASDLVKASRVSYQTLEPDYSYQQPNYQQPNYQQPNYNYSAPHDPSAHPNDAGQPGAGGAVGMSGDLLAKTSPQHGNNPPDVRRWSGVVGRDDGRPVTASLSDAVQETAAVEFQLSSDGANRYESDEQAYWNALNSRNTLSK